MTKFYLAEIENDGIQIYFTTIKDGEERLMSLDSYKSRMSRIFYDSFGLEYSSKNSSNINILYSSTDFIEFCEELKSRNFYDPVVKLAKEVI